MCGVCERIRMIRDGTNPYFVKELETGYVVIGDFQHFRGYTLFLCKEHAAELFDLAPAVRAKQLEEMTMVARAACRAFGEHILVKIAARAIEFIYGQRRDNDTGRNIIDACAPLAPANSFIHRAFFIAGLAS